MKGVLRQDIASVMNRNLIRGKKYDIVEVISDRGEAVIVEDKGGNRFSVAKSKIELITK